MFCADYWLNLDLPSIGICWHHSSVRACPDLCELLVSSVHHRARRRRGRERERASESPSRWKSQSKSSAIPKKKTSHSSLAHFLKSSKRREGSDTLFSNRIKTWRQAAPILLHAIDYTLVWSGVLSGTPLCCCFLVVCVCSEGENLSVQLKIMLHLNISNINPKYTEDINRDVPTQRSLNRISLRLCEISVNNWDDSACSCVKSQLDCQLKLRPMPVNS